VSSPTPYISLVGSSGGAPFDGPHVVRADVADNGDGTYTANYLPDYQVRLCFSLFAFFLVFFDRVVCVPVADDGDGTYTANYLPDYQVSLVLLSLFISVVVLLFFDRLAHPHFSLHSYHPPCLVQVWVGKLFRYNEMKCVLFQFKKSRTPSLLTPFLPPFMHLIRAIQI
jgi:hypothetical protein